MIFSYLLVSDNQLMLINVYSTPVRNPTLHMPPSTFVYVINSTPPIKTYYIATYLIKSYHYTFSFLITLNKQIKPNTLLTPTFFTIGHDKISVASQGQPPSLDPHHRQTSSNPSHVILLSLSNPPTIILPTLFFYSPSFIPHKN